MKSDRQILLEAVLAAPDDDAPRAAYADSMIESGTEKNAALGEFIQLQLRADQLLRDGVQHIGKLKDTVFPWDCQSGYDQDDGLPKCPLCRVLYRLERHLKAETAHGRWELQDDLSVIETTIIFIIQLPVASEVKCRWRRGLIEEVWMPRSTWLEPKFREGGRGSFDLVRVMLREPVKKMWFTDTYPACGQCEYIHWDRLSDRDLNDPQVALRPNGWQRNVLPIDVWRELLMQTDSVQHGQTRGWYPPINERFGWDRHDTEAFNVAAEQARREQSEAMIKAARNLAERVRESSNEG